MENKQIHLAPEVLAQQKAYKDGKERFRTAMKEMVQKQYTLKGLMKTERGEKQSFAQTAHAWNRWELRNLYVAYSQYRRDNGGYTKVVNDDKYSADFVKHLIEKYGSTTIHLGS